MSDSTPQDDCNRRLQPAFKQVAVVINAGNRNESRLPSLP
jgi:hypothetical protein